MLLGIGSHGGLLEQAWNLTGKLEIQNGSRYFDLMSESYMASQQVDNSNWFLLLSWGRVPSLEKHGHLLRFSADWMIPKNTVKVEILPLKSTDWRY